MEAEAALEAMANQLIDRRFRMVTRRADFRELEKENFGVRIVIDQGGYVLVVLALNRNWDRAPGLHSVASCLGLETFESLPKMEIGILEKQPRRTEEKVALLESVLDALPWEDTSAMLEIFECAEEADWERTRLLGVNVSASGASHDVAEPLRVRKLSREEFVAAARQLEEKIRQESLTSQAQHTKGTVLDMIAGIREKVERNRMPPPRKRHAALTHLIANEWKGLDALAQEIAEFEAAYRILD